MNALVPITLFGWIAVAIGLFSALRPRRAVLAAFICAWLFLPQAQIALPGLPDLTKISATVYGVLIGIILFDAGSLTRFRPKWFDFPMMCWCAAPMASSITNGLGVYDGLSASLVEIVSWGLPYFIGRLYFTTVEALRDAAIAVMIGGLIYVPLCLFEVRMSPQLHNWVYGFRPHRFGQTVRFGGYRPMVFMQHGLMVGMWMASASLVVVWLWMTKAVKSMWNIPMVLLAGALLVTTVLCKSTGALALLAGGLGVLFATKWTRARVFLLIALAVPPMYMTLRARDMWDGSHLVSAASLINDDRAQSIQTRLDNETMLVEKAKQKALFGWGGWNRWRVFDEDGDDITTSDGLWIITLSRNGLFGLATLTAAMMLPVVLPVRRMPARLWSHPIGAPVAALVTLLIMFNIDCLMNAMVNPIYMLIAGGLVAFTPRAGRPRPQRQQAYACAQSAALRRDRAGAPRSPIAPTRRVTP